MDSEDLPLIVSKWLYFVATLACAIWTVVAYNFWPLLICLIVCGVIKFGMMEFDTDWYDTTYFSIEGKLYYIYDDNRNLFITSLVFVLVVGFEVVLGLPYIFSYTGSEGVLVGGEPIYATAWFAYIPCIWHGVTALGKTVIRFMFG